MKNVVKCSAEKATHAKKGRMGSKSATYTPAFSNTFNLNPRQSTQAKRGWNPLVSDSNNYCIRTIHFYTHQRENDLILRTSFVPNDILPLVCMHVQEDHVEVSVSIAHPTYIKSPIQKFYVDSTYYYAALHKRRDNLQRFGKTLLPIGYKMYRRYKHLYQDTGQDIGQLLRLKRQSIIQDLNHFTLHRASPITLRFQY